MSENDYIAEYVKEKYPELLKTVDFTFWKLAKGVVTAISRLADSIKGFLEPLNFEPVKEDDEEIENDITRD